MPRRRSAARATRARRPARGRRTRRRRPAARTAGARRIALAFLAAIAVGVAAIVVAGVAGGFAAESGGGRQCAADVRDGEPDVAGYGPEQLANAAVIVDTATALGLGPRGRLLGVMAAMGESGLRNLPYGDYETSGVRNPDGSPTTSIGLFQQQDSWGTREERLDPATSARLFYERLVLVPGWEDLPPSEAIHRVQVNSDPDHYARWQDRAAEVVARLTEPC